MYLEKYLVSFRRAGLKNPVFPNIVTLALIDFDMDKVMLWTETAQVPLYTGW